MRWFSFFLFTLAATAQTGGWIDIFPDAKLTGWTRIAIPPTGQLSEASQWKVDGAQRLLVCDGKGGHDMLRYDREFADFILHVEWRFTPAEGNPRYNSGVFVRNDAQGVIWHQAQCGSSSGAFLFGDSPVNGVTQRFNLRAQAVQDAVKPAGEWNTYDIRCDGRNISVTANGKVTSTYERCEVPKGYVALEAEGYRIEFRNLRVKPLPATSPSSR